MALDADNILLHVKRTLHSSVRLAYQSASEYPVALGIGMLLLFLHKLCPSLFTFFLSSSPVFLLTALLLGALLSYGEPSAPVIGEETPEDKKKSSPTISRISITECSVAKEAQNVAITHMSRSFESPVVCIEETTFDSMFHDTHRDEDSIVTSVSTYAVRCAEASELAKNEVVIVEREEHVQEVCDKVELQQFQSNAAEGVSVEEAENAAVKVHAATRFECPVMYTVDKTSEGVLLIDTQCDQGNVTSMSTDTVLCAESSRFDRNGIIAEREEEEHVKEICEQVELQQFESTITQRCHYEVNNQYQFGELMSSCWQPVTRQDPCSDSESDLTESSSDASITDIIPMLDELNPPIDLGTSHPSSTFRDNLNAGSSDEDEDEDDSEEDGNLSSDEDGAEEEKKDDGNNWKGNSLDAENNGNLESLMARRRAKNVLKFELDRRLMDLQAADAVQKMEEASRFHVQVPSISTPRPDPSNDSEDTVELPQVPDSAPSVLLPWRKPFDVPFDQIVDRDSRLQETWTPRSGFSSAQGRKRDSLYVRPSTYPRHHNGIKPEKSEFSGKDAGDNHSECDSEQPLDNNGKLFGSLEPHIGDEIKIVSAAISDVCVLEANHGINEDSNDSINDTNSFYVQKSMSSTSDVNDSIYAGNEQSVLCSLSEEHNTDEHIVEEDSMSEVNSLFKWRMEEVLVQSISESGIGQPLTVKLEHELSDTLVHAEPAIPLIEVRSVEDLNSQFAQLNGEALLAAAASVCSCDDDQLIQDRPSEALPVENEDTDTEDGHSSDCPLDDGPMAVKAVVEGEGEPKEVLAEDGDELPVVEASSVEEMSSLFRQLEEAAAGPALVPAGSSESEHMFVGQHAGETETDCGVLVPDAKPAWDDTDPTYVQLSIGSDKMKIPGDGEVILDNSAELNSGPCAKDAGRSGSDDTKVFEAIESLESA